MFGRKKNYSKDKIFKWSEQSDVQKLLYALVPIKNMIELQNGMLLNLGQNLLELEEYE